MKIAILFTDKHYDEVWRKVLPSVSLHFTSKENLAFLINNALQCLSIKDLEIDADCLLLEDDVVNAVLSPLYNDDLYVLDTEFNDRSVFTRAELIERGLYIDYIKKYDNNHTDGQISLSLNKKYDSLSVSLNFAYNDSFCDMGTIRYNGVNNLKDNSLSLVGEFCKNMALRWHTLLTLKEECKTLRLKNKKEDIEKMILKLKDYPELDVEKKRLQFTIS